MVGVPSCESADDVKQLALVDAREVEGVRQDGVSGTSKCEFSHGV